MTGSNSALAMAFPSAVRDDALKVSSALPAAPLTAKTFSVSVGGELVQIPDRIYHDPAMVDAALFTDLQLELFDCLMTRHHSGFVREQHLRKVLRSNNEWIPAFVIQLSGEYVIEILCAIRNGLQDLDPSLYRTFLTSNPEFFILTKQRVASYWRCYHSVVRREDYAGHQIVRFFDGLIAPSNTG
jgi:hypothetical protein